MKNEFMGWVCPLCGTGLSPMVVSCGCNTKTKASCTKVKTGCPEPERTRYFSDKDLDYTTSTTKTKTLGVLETFHLGTVTNLLAILEELSKNTKRKIGIATVGQKEAYPFYGVYISQKITIADLLNYIDFVKKFLVNPSTKKGILENIEACAIYLLTLYELGYIMNNDQNFDTVFDSFLDTTKKLENEGIKTYAFFNPIDMVLSMGNIDTSQFYQKIKRL